MYQSSAASAVPLEPPRPSGGALHLRSSLPFRGRTQAARDRITPPSVYSCEPTRLAVN